MILRAAVIWREGRIAVRASLSSPSKAWLADAAAMMSANRDCQDVFVSKTGDRKEPILGWITNVLITQSSAS